jgi:hypothetical protein
MALVGAHCNACSSHLDGLVTKRAPIGLAVSFLLAATTGFSQRITSRAQDDTGLYTILSYEHVVNITGYLYPEHLVILVLQAFRQVGKGKQQPFVEAGIWCPGMRLIACKA